MNLNLYLTPYIKINSQWVTDLTIKAKTIKTSRRKHKESLHDLGLGK